MTLLSRFAGLLAALSFVLPAAADEDPIKAIRSVVPAKLGGAQIEAIQPAAMPGLWEVQFRTPDGPHRNNFV